MVFFFDTLLFIVLGKANVKCIVSRNVKLVEKILNKQKYSELFPEAASVYSYSNLLKAVAKFQGFCDEENEGIKLARSRTEPIWSSSQLDPNEVMCRKILASFFAIAAYRSKNLTASSTPKVIECDNWSPKYFQKYFQCQGNFSYYDRGAYGLRGNYNLGKGVTMTGILMNPTQQDLIDSYRC